MKIKSILILCGTVLHLATNNAAAAPGLKEHRIPWRVLHWNSWPDSYTPYYGRNVPAPYAANAWGSVEWWGHNPGTYDGDGYWPPPTGTYSDDPAYNDVNSDTTFYYSGYMYVGEGSNLVTFISTFDDCIYLIIDDQGVLWNVEYNQTAVKTMPLTTGWHKFDFLLDNGGGGWGPMNSGESLGWLNHMGFAVDWSGRAGYGHNWFYGEDGNLWDHDWNWYGHYFNNNELYPDSPGNYVFPFDPGDGSFFSTVRPVDGAELGNPLPPVKIGTTSATLPSSIAIGPDSTVTPCVFYGIADGEDVVSAWDGCEALSAPQGSTGSEYVPFEIAIAGLPFNEEIHYRFGFIDSNGGTNFHSASASFTTRAVLASHPATPAGGTAVSLPAHISLATGESGVLRVYYGTEDFYDDAAAWGNAYEDIAIGGDFTGATNIIASGFVDGTTNYYRHAFVSAVAGDISFAPQSIMFVMGDANVPSAFRWLPLDTDATDWENPFAWENLDGFLRHVPGMAPGIVGDTISLVDMPTRIFNINGGISIAGIDAGTWGYGLSYFFVAGAGLDNPVDFNLQTADGSTFPLVLLNADNVCFGTIGNPANNLVNLVLHQPISISKSVSHGTGFLFGFPMHGGDDTAPSHITVSNGGNEWSGLNMSLINPGNTFRGDIFLGTPGTRAVRLSVGVNVDGQGSVYAADGMLGDPANRIVSHSTANAVNVHTENSFDWARAIVGECTLNCSYRDSWGIESYDSPRHLNLLPGSRFEPGYGDDFGRIICFASALNFDPATVLRAKVRADGASSVLELKLRANKLKSWYENPDDPPEPGVLALAGSVEIVEDESAGRIRPGAQFFVLETTYDNTAVTGKMKSATTGFILHHETDSEGYFRVIAEKTGLGSLLVVR